MSTKGALIFTALAGTAGAVLYSIKKDFKKAKDADQAATAADQATQTPPAKNDQPKRNDSGPTQFDV